MKKSILIGALAVMMLFAFTACEQQMPTYKEVSYIEVEQTGDFVIGQVFDASKFTVTANFTDGSSSVVKGASVALAEKSEGVSEDWKDGAKVEATFKANGQEFTNSTTVKISSDITNINITGEGLKVTTQTSDVQDVFDALKADIKSGKRVLTVTTSNGSATFSTADYANFESNYVVNVDADITEEEIEDAIENEDLSALSNIALTFTITDRTTSTAVATDVPSNLTISLVEATPAAGATIASVEVTQTNEVFAINDTLADVEYAVVATYNDEASTKVRLDSYTLTFNDYNTAFKLSDSENAPEEDAYAVTVKVGDKEYPSTLTVATTNDYPVAITVSTKDSDPDEDGKQVKTYAAGDTIAVEDFEYKVTKWASGYTYGEDDTAPTFTPASEITVTPASVKKAQPDGPYAVSFKYTATGYENNDQKTTVSGVSTVTVKNPTTEG